MKPLLVIAVIALILGGAFFGFAFYQNGSFDFHSYVTKTTVIEDDFSSIVADLDEAKLSLLPATDGKCTLVITERAKLPHTFTAESGTLKLQAPKKHWYDHITIFSKVQPITLYLPASEYDTLTLKTDTGDITVDNAFTFESISLTASTGDIALYASAKDTCRIKTSTGAITAKDMKAASFIAERSTGDLRIENLTVTDTVKLKGSTGTALLENISAGSSFEISTDTGSITANAISADSLSIDGRTSKIHLTKINTKTLADIKTSTGDISITDLKGNSLKVECSTGDAKLTGCILQSTIDASASTGDIIFSGCDAPLIRANVSTGDVLGTLLSPKIFNAKSSTGKVTVPQSDPSGGTCNITVDTGKINISIK